MGPSKPSRQNPAAGPPSLQLNTMPGQLQDPPACFPWAGMAPPPGPAAPAWPLDAAGQAGPPLPVPLGPPGSAWLQDAPWGQLGPPLMGQPGSAWPPAAAVQPGQLPLGPPGSAWPPAAADKPGPVPQGASASAWLPAGADQPGPPPRAPESSAPAWMLPKEAEPVLDAEEFPPLPSVAPQKPVQKQVPKQAMAPVVISRPEIPEVTLLAQKKVQQPQPRAVPVQATADTHGGRSKTNAGNAAAGAADVVQPTMVLSRRDRPAGDSGTAAATIEKVPIFGMSHCGFPS